MSDLDKIIPVAGQTAGNAIAAVRQVQNRLGRIREVRDRQGEFGLLFRIAYEFPQHLYRWGLVLCALAGLAVFVGGVLKLVESTVLAWLQQAFTDQWLTVFAIGLLLLGITALEPVTWTAILALGLVPTVRRSIDWYNIRQFCTLLEKPKPLVLNSTAIGSLADLAIKKLTTNSDLGLQFASKPIGLTDTERANAALLGCLIEQEHHVRRWQLRNWGDFYKALVNTKVDGVSIFADTTIRNVRAQHQDYYAFMRAASDPNLREAQQPPLEDSAAVAEDVMKVVDVLIAMYEGSARNLARADASRMDIRLAFERASEFPHFDGESIRPQFLKLAVRWDVWPGIETGNVIYPFSSSLAALLLDRNVLVTLPEVKEFGFKSADERRVAREAIRQTVASVKHFLETVERPEYRAFYESLQSSEVHPVEWELAQYVDFVLWAESYELTKNDGFSNWRLGADKVVSRKI
jgi:hypothetical protein